jgi:hypothetical protein
MAMKNFANGELQIALNGGGERVRMLWNGRSTDREPGRQLTPYLNDLLDELSGRELLISFQGLAYMNSSTVTPIIQFLKHLNERRIDTRVTYDGRSKWQRSSFRALSGLAMMMKHVTVEEA